MALALVPQKLVTNQTRVIKLLQLLLGLLCVSLKTMFDVVPQGLEAVTMGSPARVLRSCIVTLQLLPPPCTSTICARIKPVITTP